MLAEDSLETNQQLDTFGEQHGVNYSEVLREGLKHRYRALHQA
ncbi:hypothetical protein [Bifidobacterium callitrichos]|nr:hypothetical protein [Bifidobacterium callitrichos]